MSPATLEALETDVQRDLQLLGYPKRDWVPPPADNEVLDVLIVGGGQSGLSAAFALLRENVRRLLVVDQKPAGREGPWRDFARMVTLRTPKYVTGPDLGIPSLTFQSWYEAQFGSQAWVDLKLIPKEMWSDYLIWYRKVLALPVRNGVQVGAVRWEDGKSCWKVPALTSQGPEILWARKVVLATGIDGGGRWETPPVVRNLPAHLWSHTRDDIDFKALRGKRVGVLGAGASAFDNASVALEAGANVDLFFRRKKLVDVNPYRWAEFTGFLKHHADLDDAQRWKFIRHFVLMGQLPPADTLARAQQFPGFSLHAGSPWTEARMVSGGTQVEVTTPNGTYVFDYLVIGTGFVTDLASRPELADVESHIARWSDRYTPPAGQEFDDLGRYPYLGPGGEFVARDPVAAPWLHSLFCYTFAGLPSLGFGGAFISGLKYSLPKLVDGVTGQLYRDHADHFFQTLRDYHVAEF